MDSEQRIASATPEIPGTVLVQKPEFEPSPPSNPPVKVKAENDSATAHTRSRAKLDGLSASEIKQKTANVIVHSRLKPASFVQDSVTAEPNVTSQHTVNGRTFYQYDDLPLNRRGYKYRICKPNQLFSANKYLTSDSRPYAIRASFFDKSQGIACSEDMLTVTTQHGWLSARCNVGMREGKHYFEYEIVNANNSTDKAHVRIGIGRKELALDAPVGFDGYGYALRDLNGQKITLSRPQDFMSEGFSTGDIIGFLVDLPPLAKQRESNTRFASEFKPQQRKRKKMPQPTLEEEERIMNMHGNILRDQVPIKYKSGLFYEQFEYTKTKQMDHLLNPVVVFGEKAVLEKKLDLQPKLPKIPDSHVRIYKNGVFVGEMFSDLYSFLPLNATEDTAADPNTVQQQNPSYRNTDDGSLGYFPMMSVFQDGMVKINPGPDFAFPIPEDARPLSERYDEKVTEEWLWDLVDEVEAQYLDSFE